MPPPPLPLSTLCVYLALTGLNSNTNSLTNRTQQLLLMILYCFLFCFSFSDESCSGTRCCPVGWTFGGAGGHCGFCHRRRYYAQDSKTQAQRTLAHVPSRRLRYSFKPLFNEIDTESGPCTRYSRCFSLSRSKTLCLLFIHPRVCRVI